jgi:hypothetical protein
MGATRLGRNLPRVVVFLCLVAALLVPVAPMAPTALAACAPRPNVGVQVGPGSGGLLVTISANTNGNTPTNQLSTLSFGAGTNALIDVPGQPPGRTGNFDVTLAPNTQQTSFTLRQANTSQAATVPLTVSDTCGPWPTFVGGGPTVFSPPPGATPTATPTVVKVTSLQRSQNSLQVGQNQGATWADIASPTTQDWIGLFMPGASNSEYLGSPRFTGSTQPSGATNLVIPLEATDGNYELRLFSDKSTTRLASSQNFAVGRLPSTLTPVATPGVPPAVVVAPATVVSTGGVQTSIQLDRHRNGGSTPDDLPVVSFADSGNLKILRCGNKECSSGNSIVTIGPGATHTSLQLDNRPDVDPPDVLSYPVVSYYDGAAQRLKVLRCVDLTCANPGRTIATPDATVGAGQFTSLALDGASNPVVSYYGLDGADRHLKVLRCGNLTCNAPVGCGAGQNCITTPDLTSNINGLFTSLRLDSAGRPVVSYYDLTNQALKVLHCGNTLCTSGNTINTVDAIGNVGQFTSLALDPLGHPIIAYYDVTNQRLRLAQCADVTCASPAAIVTVDALGNVGQFASLRLDRFGRAVVSYYDATNLRLKVAYCSRTLCTTPNTLAIPDSGGVGQFASLVLDALDAPVVSYFDQGANVGFGGLKILHCSSPTCITTPEEDGDVGQYTSLRLDGQGRPVVSYYHFRDGEPGCTVNVECFNVGLLHVLRCGNQSCSDLNSVSIPDFGGDTGRGSSLALDASGRPVVAYLSASTFGAATGQLKVLHCGDAGCFAPNGCGVNQNCVATPDPSTTVGPHISLALDASGNPAIAYYDNNRLKLIRCANANCTGATTFHPSCVGGTNCVVVLDQSANVGQYPSLGIDPANSPIVSYYDATNGRLRIIRCPVPQCTTTGTNCSPGQNCWVFGDPSPNNVGQFSSLSIDAGGNPAVSYYDATNGDLKVLRCINANCVGNNNIYVPDAAGNVGQFTSIVVPPSTNRPVVSYYDVTNRDLKLLHCGNDLCSTIGTNCAAGQNCLVTADTVARQPCQNCTGIPGDDVGRYTSLAVDPSTGFPFVSYYNATNGDLKMLRCRSANCN